MTFNADLQEVESFQDQGKGVLTPFYLGQGDLIRLTSKFGGLWPKGLAELKFQTVFSL